jgi:hypothetical protein
MKVFEGKTSTERNKIIAAGVLGLIALVALYLAFGRSFFGGSSPTAKTSPTPRASVTPRNTDDRPVPTASEQDFVYQTTPIDYRPGTNAPDPGRNIFAFYEPPAPTPYSPTPIPTPTPIAPTPTPTPFPMTIAQVNPQAIYAGSQGFRMEISGSGFTPDTSIYFNQNKLQTQHVGTDKLVTDIPANFITQEGPRQLIVQSADGKLYSDQFMWTVQAPPRPTVSYIGMIGRKRYNNDTAYFTEQGKPTPFGARLNDVINGRFRVINITASEVLVEDVNLGFKHHVPLAKGTQSGGGLAPVRGGVVENYPTYDPSQNIPGVPPNIPRYVPPQPQPKKTPDPNDDVDDNDDGDGGN